MNQDEVIQSSAQAINNWTEYLKNSKEEFKLKYSSKNTHSISCTAADYKIIRCIGEGGFGLVLLVQRQATSEFSVMKIYKKKLILEKKYKKFVSSEKNILRSIMFQYVIHMDCYFKDKSFIYFIMPFMQGGDLYTLMRCFQKLTEKQAQFYLTQVILAIEYLHYLNIVHRDLKAENILIDITGYIKLGDFGFAKVLHGRTYSMVGTPCYMAPEVLLNKGYGLAVDYWSLGVLTYELCSGKTPFPCDVTQIDQIISGKFHFVAQHSNYYVDFVSLLLEPNLSRRLGNLKGGIEDIKHHKWFEINIWQAILNHQLDPPLKPQVSGPTDTRYFDMKYQSLTLSEEVANEHNDEHSFHDF